MSQPLTAKETKIKLPSDQDISGRTLGSEEIEALSQVIRSGTLTSTKGAFVKTMEKKFAETIGSKHVYACASGTAAIHTAVAAINPNVGDEIVTSPITDMGAIAPILYQGAVPVFADVDPRTCNVTAKTIEPCLSNRTKAIIITHLFGNPCEMGEIMELSRAKNIPVIEDCAQAFLARYDGRLVGTMGAIGCFSLQQGKHITTGEGGLVATDDDALGRHMYLFVNKAWGYGDPKPDHYFLALNYRMSELIGAVAVAQLPKLADVVQRRVAAAGLLTEKLKGIRGVETPWVPPKGVHTYWKYCLRIDGEVIPGGAVAMGKVLGEKGIASAPRYIQKPAFMCQIIQEQNTFGKSRFPFTLARPEVLNYDRSRYPGTFAALEGVLVLPWNEKYEAEHVEYIARSIREAAQQLGGNV